MLTFMNEKGEKLFFHFIITRTAKGQRDYVQVRAKN